MREAKEWIALLDYQKRAIEEHENSVGRGLYLATDIKRKERKKEENENDCT